MNPQVMLSRRSTSQETASIMYLFGSFRSSERRALLAAAANQQGEFLEALADFLERWANADWLEEYNVERVGKWISKSCEPEMVAKIRQRIDGLTLANRPTGPCTDIRTRTYEAFLKSLEPTAKVH